jgi:arsenite/tail-anchored protein-transporting ATPase
MFALEAAESGPTLLVTTDPASSLSDALGVRVGSEPAAVRGAGHLYAARIDAAAAFERWLAPRRELLAAIALRGTYLDEEDVARLLKLSLPGIDETIGLLEITRMTSAGAAYERVVVDTAPTGHTLRLLAAPALLSRVAGVLDSLQAHHRTVVSALRGAYQSDAADSLIVELDRDGDALAATLRDRRVTSVSWITLPEPMALEETSDAIAALEASGIHVDRLIVNRTTPRPGEAPGGTVAPKPQSGEGGLVPPKPQSGEGGCGWCEARHRFEARALAPVARRFPGQEILALPEADREPQGIAALRRLRHDLMPWTPVDAVPPAARRMRASLFPQSLAPEHGRHESTPERILEDVAGDARWILFGGKGGVGKSTCAAAAALLLARRTRVLLLSTDPAHSLGDVFGTAFDNDARPVPGGPPTLRVREIDARAEMDQFRRRYVEAVDEAFSRIARSAGGDQAAFRDLIDLAPPGIDEVIAIAGVADAIADAQDGREVIVTDTAPTGHALRLLQTPAVLREWTKALMALLVKYREIVGAGTLAALLVQLSKRLRGLNEILRDPVRTRFNIVTRAAVLPASESASLIESLRSLDIPIGALIVNAAGGGDCRRCRTHTAAQVRQIGSLRRSARAGAYAIIEAPAEVPPPHGAAALADWGLAWRRLT